MPDPVPQALAVPESRTGMPSPELDRTAFETRFRSRFADPAFDPLRDEIDRLAAAAWDGYIGGRKSPLTRPAGPSFAEPDYELALDWPGIAVALTLMDDIAHLKQENRLLRQRLSRFVAHP